MADHDGFITLVESPNEDVADIDRDDAWGSFETRALEAWRSDPNMETMVDSITDGLSDRILAAETSPALQLAPEPDSTHTRRVSLGWRRFAAGMLVGASLTAAAALGLRPWSHSAISATSTRSAPRVADAVQPQPNTSGPMPGALTQPNFPVHGTPGSPIPAELDIRIADYISDYGADWGPAFRVHGSVAVARAGQVVYARGFGFANPQTQAPNQAHTRFRLGLLTEQFTAAAILKLRDKGHLSLEDRVARFVPELPRGEDITIRQLLAHRSGIANYTSAPEFAAWKAQPHTTEQMLARIGNTELAFEPGREFQPSNGNYFALGAIVERVSGQSYGEFVRTELFASAHMHDSTFGDAYASGSQARGQVWNDEEQLEPPDAIDMSVFGGAGGLVSTTLDLVRWNTALVHNGTVLSQSSVRDMLRAGEDGYGYGLAVGRGYGQKVLSFPAAIDGFNGAMLHFVEDATTVVVLCNTEVVPANRVASDIAMLVYGDMPTRRREAQEVAIEPSTYSRYVGTYTLRPQSRARLAPEQLDLLQQVHVRAVDERLYFDVPGHGVTWMHPMGQSRFFFKDHSGNRVRFELDAGGAATRMTLRTRHATLAFERAQQP